jgi:hypothetical protein
LEGFHEASALGRHFPGRGGEGFDLRDMKEAGERKADADAFGEHGGDMEIE